VGAPERTVFHCFSGDTELASILSEHGWYASFAGTVTFKNAPNLRDALEALPRRLVLIETDSPFLTPVPFRGRPNSSYLIPHTLRAMAAHLGTDVSMLAALISSNTEEVYGRWDSEPVMVPENPTGDRWPCLAPRRSETSPNCSASSPPRSSARTSSSTRTRFGGSCGSRA
jgi:TatD DNase family protein